MLEMQPSGGQLVLETEFWKQIPAFAQVTQTQFLDYRWQLQHSVCHPEDLTTLLSGWVEPEFLNQVNQGVAQSTMSLRLTPYLLSLINWQNPWTDPIRRQFIPLGDRLPNHPGLTLDALQEQQDSPIPGLIHRYPHKALFLPVKTCPIYCRFCTRSYTVGLDTPTVQKAKLIQNPAYWQQIFQYIAAHPTLEDIVISGGDAYQLTPEALLTIGTELLLIPHIQRIRIATRGLAALPMKLLTDTSWLKSLLQAVQFGQQHQKEVSLQVHFNQAQEITPITHLALQTLRSSGIPIRNQTVILRGVNDTLEQLQQLIKSLIQLQIQPYYVYQPDLVPGVEDLRSSLQVAIELEKQLRGTLPGFQMPTFVLDTTGGKRHIHSYEVYDRKTGISLYTAPSIKPGQTFFYFDPLHSLSPEIQKDWQDPHKQTLMRQRVLELYAS